MWELARTDRRAGWTPIAREFQPQNSALSDEVSRTASPSAFGLASTSSERVQLGRDLRLAMVQNEQGILPELGVWAKATAKTRGNCEGRAVESRFLPNFPSQTRKVLFPDATLAAGTR